MHEVFLSRLENHPIFRADTNFRVFLEYEQDLMNECTLSINFRINSSNAFEYSQLSVRGKNKKEKLLDRFLQRLRDIAWAYIKGR